MNLPEIPLFSAMAERMKWLTARQDVLARNIANADTPDFAALDIKDLDFKSLVSQLGAIAPARTDPHHLAGTQPVRQSGIVKEKSPYEVAPGGNGVVLEEQLTKMNDNQARYSLMVNLYRKQIDLLKLAIGRSNS